MSVPYGVRVNIFVLSSLRLCVQNKRFLIYINILFMTFPPHRQAWSYLRFCVQQCAKVKNCVVKLTQNGIQKAFWQCFQKSRRTIALMQWRYGLLHNINWCLFTATFVFELTWQFLHDKMVNEQWHCQVRIYESLRIWQSSDLVTYYNVNHIIVRHT